MMMIVTIQMIVAAVEMIMINRPLITWLQRRLWRYHVDDYDVCGDIVCILQKYIGSVDPYIQKANKLAESVFWPNKNWWKKCVNCKNKFTTKLSKTINIVKKFQIFRTKLRSQPKFFAFSA